MLKRNREIWYALIAIVAVTALYLIAYQQASSFPAASSLVGHGIGILGFILMLMTETLYSIRKQLTDARWGSMADWLRFHIVTGLVGPYMVLLHTTMTFRGLAGVATLLTVVVVISGVIGRYIYTAVPRSIDGTEADLDALNLRAARADSFSADDSSTASTIAAAPSLIATSTGGDAQVVAERRTLNRRLHRLATQRGALASWQSVHVPLTWALFVTAAVHVFAALYYVTLQR